MKERPILFSGPMVRAILDGSKTQTRRLLKAPRTGHVAYVAKDGKPYQIEEGEVGEMEPFGDSAPLRCPYGAPGDRLWVRETWQAWHQVSVEYDEWDECLGPPWDMIGKYGHPTVEYRADEKSLPETWRPAIHMPRWAARISLEVVDVRVERLQRITRDDALAEGVERKPWYLVDGGPEHWFHTLWDSINGDRASWASNPWVWVIGFKRVTP